jgi:tetratricopeptide (TPR) repeat protein
VVALNNLAFLLALRGSQGSEAIRYVSQAIEITGPTAELLDTRAMAHLSAGRTKEAIEDLETARAQKPQVAAIWYHLAQAYLEAKRPDDAKTAFEEAKKLRLSVPGLHPLEQERYPKVVQALGSE